MPGEPDPHVFSGFYATDCPTVLSLSADATTDRARPNDALGGSALNRLGGAFLGLDRYEMWLELDESEIPAGTDTVTVELFARDDLGFFDGTVDVYRVPSAWAENTITATNAPLLEDGSLPIATLFDTDIDESGWVRLDLTDAVAGWLADPTSNHGVLLLSQGFNGPALSVQSFESRESSLGSRRPRVVAVPARP